ncbi:MAG: Nif11-like leader peptide family natural product precursor [Desulfomonile sp.]
MSKSEMDRLANAVRADKGLQEEVKKAATSNEALVAFAKSKGYDVNLNEMIAYIEQRKATLSEEDLDKVAGGKKKKGTANVQTNVEVQAEVTVQVVQTQTAATTTTAAAEAECVIVAT